MTSTPDHHPVLPGKAVTLKAISLREVTATYLSWLEDPEVMEGIATSGYDLEKLRNYVSERIGKKDTAFYAIFANDSGKHIGNIKLDFHDARANVSEMGLLIGDKSYWGKGIGFEACRLILRYGFDQLKLRKIWLAVYEPNIAGRKLYEKLGFRLEGTLRKHIAINGKFYDKYLMGIFKEELV